MTPVKKKPIEKVPHQVPPEEAIKTAQRLISQKQLIAAKICLQNAMKTFPNHIAILDLLGFVLFFLKEFDDCESINRQVLSLKPNHAYALSGLGIVLGHKGDLTKGIYYLEKAIRQKPDWTEPYWDLAIMHQNAGQPEEAIEVLQRGIQSIPSAQARFQKLLNHISKSR